MAVPSAYLTSTKNLSGIFDALRRASVPERFGYEFLKQIGFASSSDRPMIPVLKSIGFIDDGNKPTDRYRRYKDPNLSKRVLAEGVRDAYSDLFAVDTQAHLKDVAELQGMFSRLSDKGESVTSKMAMTFKALSGLADFENVADEVATGDGRDEAPDPPPPPPPATENHNHGTAIQLRHDIHIHLPESDNVAVYDAIFQSVRSNLLS